MSGGEPNRFGALDCLNQVAEFHRTFRHPIVESPGIPDPDRAALRIRLLQEELSELQEAVERGDITEAADALCDLQYVLSGAVLEFGLAERFPALFDEVQRSNMSKACRTRAEAEETIHWYAENKGEEAHAEEHGGMFLVYRNRDKKTLKSIRYAPARLEPIVRGDAGE